MATSPQNSISYLFIFWIIFPKAQLVLNDPANEWLRQPSDHMENLLYCFDNSSKGLYALLRFYVPSLLKISPRFSKACYVTNFELDKVHESNFLNRVGL